MKTPPAAVCYRPARKEDCHGLPELKLAASGGILEYLLDGMLDETHLRELIESSLRDGEPPYDHRSCRVALVAGAVVGMTHAYPSKNHCITPGMSRTFPEERLDRLRPLFNARIDDSLFLDTLSVMPGFQGHGIGSELLALTLDDAARAGVSSVSLALFADNSGGLRFYRRHGFSVAAEIPLEPHPLIPHEGGVLMMVRRV